jgi:hypothetical protein
VRLHHHAHVIDRALRGDPEHLREREPGNRLHQGRDAAGERERHQQLDGAATDHVVDQELRGRRQHEAGEAAHQHQREAERETSAMTGEQCARLAEAALDLGLARFGSGHGASPEESGRAILPLHERSVHEATGRRFH